MNRTPRCPANHERAVCDFIATELRAALLPVDRTSQGNLQFTVNPATVDALTFGNRDSIFWQAPLASDQTLGDIAEIGYFVKWDTSSAQNPKAQLCRFFLNSSSGSTPKTNFKIYSDPANWISDTIIEAEAPIDKASAYQGLFAENVLGFWIRCLDGYGRQITQDYNGASLELTTGKYAFDSRRGYTDTKGGKSPFYTDSTGTKRPLCMLPPTVEVSLVLLDARAAKRIGPAEQAIITKSVRDSADADSFLAAALAIPALQKVRSSLRGYQIRINLQNSR